MKIDLLNTNRSLTNDTTISEKNHMRNSSQFSGNGAVAYLSPLLTANLEFLSNSMRGSRLGTGSGFMVLGYNFESSHFSEDSSDTEQKKGQFTGPLQAAPWIRAGLWLGEEGRPAGRRGLHKDLITTVCHL